MNADPKPGRWILPLVIIGMIAFTYYFVRELPAAVPDTTIAAGNGTTSTTAPDNETTTTGSTPLDPAVQEYLDAVDDINADLQLARIELVAANSGFDANPREVQFPDAVTRFQGVINDTTALVTRFTALTAPEGLEANHTLLGGHLDTALKAAQDALGGLQSSDPGDIRRSNVTAYVNAATSFETETTNLHTAAAG